MDNLIKPLPLEFTKNRVSSRSVIPPPEQTATLLAAPVVSEFREDSLNIYYGSGYDTIFVLQSNGFPWSMTKQEIMQFFVGVNILNGTKGIHFIIDNRINKCNKLYIQLATETDYRKAQCYNNKKLNGLNIEGNSVNILNFSQQLIFNSFCVCVCSNCSANY